MRWFSVIAKLLLPAVALAVPLSSVVLAEAGIGHDSQLIVSTASDVANGNVSSPAALAANPGPDGISFREALLATDNAPGPHAIAFSPSLAGETIYLQDSLPSLTRDYVSIDGLVDADGAPTVTIDGDGIEWPGTTLDVMASHVAIRHLRLTRIRDNAMISVSAGAREDGRTAPQAVSDVVVEDNVFDQTGYDEGGLGVTVATESPALYATVGNAIIKGNRFVNLTRESDSAVGVSVGASGNHTTVQGVLVYENEFDGTELPIEVNSFLNSDNTITGTKIVRNTFTNSDDGNGGMTMLVQGELGLPMPSPASRNAISDTLVEGNRFWGNSGSFLSVYGGTFNAENNHVSGISIVNNVLDGGYGLRFTGGTATPGEGGSVAYNTVSGVRIQNNTLDGADLAIEENWGDAHDNSVSDLQISNSVVWGGSISSWLTTDTVSHSVFCKSGFPGVNGIICPADPLFVDADGVDFHLQAGSAAIDAGTSDGGVPTVDRECRPRYDDPATPNTGAGSPNYYDMGAYEYGAPSGECSSPDTTPPETTIDTAPADLIGDMTPTFTFSSSEAGSVFRCRIDALTEVSCGSGYTAPALSDGPHEFRVWAVDASGNADTTAALTSFVVDTTPPDTFIVSGPPALTSDSTPTFAFSSSEAGSTFECALDGAPFSSCSSPSTIAVASDGSHAFRVRARDSAGNTDASAATRSFALDTTPPETAISGGPSGAVRKRSVTFALSSSETGSRFECRIDGGTFEPCASSWTISALADGSHRFEARAIDSAGNTDPSAARRSFTIDTRAPQTKIVRSPARKTRARKATFKFKSSERGSTFRCKLDGQAFRKCSATKTFRKLKPGSHILRVRATDVAGNVDRSPATSRWKIVR
jgi:hypothetical protein